MREGALDAFWAAVDAAAADRNAPIVTPDAAAPALAAYLGEDGIDGVQWRRVAPGLFQSVLSAGGQRRGSLRLLRIAPGTRMPRHTHSGRELTLLLEGAYEDEFGRFSAGDVAEHEDDVVHAPTAVGDRPCICLVATEAPLRFHDLVGRLMQPFVGL